MPCDEITKFAETIKILQLRIMELETKLDTHQHECTVGPYKSHLAKRVDDGSK